MVYSVRGLTRIYRTGPDEVHVLRGVDLDFCRRARRASWALRQRQVDALNLLGGPAPMADNRVPR
jgi:hypothetical protein